MTKKKIILDSIYNIIASIIPIAVLQIIILPAIANRLGDSHYGLIITLISLVSLFSQPIGNVLNNIRLLKNKNYEDNNLQGDFNVLLIIGVLVNSLTMVIGTLFYEDNISFVNIILIIVISGLNLLREYIIVAFRLTLNFKAILINNILLAIGYIIGFLLFLIINYWHIIFICGYVFSLIYIIRNSNLLKERISRTILFKNTSYNVVALFVASFFGTAISYADKLILHPLLGADVVAIYYSATIIGKMISMGITPISGVFLSYLAKIDRIKIKNFIYLISFTVLVGMLGYVICILLSKPILLFLYPDWAYKSMELIYVTTASTIVELIASIINPLILRYNNVNWQILISGINITIYMVCTIVFFNLYGLIGFCIGVLCASIFKLMLMIIIFTISISKNKQHG